ncbi:unnamed protein product, partial [Brenthis ino]
MLRVLVLSVLIVFVGCQTTQVSRCLFYNADLPMNAYVEGCIVPPCLLPQGQDAVINVIFRAPRIIKNMKTLASASLLGITPIEHDLEENAITCNFLTNTYCPLLPDEVVQYKLKMFIETFFPVNLPVIVEFRVADENDDLLWCLRLNIRIAPPLAIQ